MIEDNHPVKLLTPVEIAYLHLFCDECDTVPLVFEGTLDIPGQEVHKYKCPKCMREFYSKDKVGIVIKEKQ